MNLCEGGSIEEWRGTGDGERGFEVRWRKCRRNYWPALSGVLGRGWWVGVGWKGDVGNV